MLELRPQDWQQAVLVIAPFALVVAYICWTYFLVRGRSVGSVLLRLFTATAVFTVLWIIVDIALFYLAWMGTSDATAAYASRMNTYRATIGLPFHALDGALGSSRIPDWLRVLPLVTFLLTIGMLVITAQKLLAKGRFAIEQRGKLYLGILSAISLAILLVLLWPQALRNPQMPSVPIPDRAEGVKYTHSADEHHWPITTFGLEGGGVRSLLMYYQEALTASGWTLERSEAQLEPVYGSGTVTATLSLGNKVLEVTIYGMYATHTTIVERQAGPAELAQLASLPKPTPTPTLEPPPPPVQTVIQPVPSVFVPLLEGTALPPVPIITPSSTPVPPTPTIHVWSAPIPIQAITTSVMSTTAEVGLSQTSAIDRTESICQLIWAPTGDKLLYLTMSGNLYWSNPDGSSATLLHQYGEASAELEDQHPMTNTLLIYHLGQLQGTGDRASTHMDVIRFTLGQSPTLQEGPDIPHTPHHLRWWSPTRASGISYAGYDGSDLLVTVDQNGNLVNEINVPYMINGDVQLGGEWLAYTTSIQVDNPVDSTTPDTGYLLNLNTGQRLQVTQPGGGGVGNWSPDGNWFLSVTSLGTSLVSADGHEWIIIPNPNAGINAVWSPDSKYLAYTMIQDAPSSNEFMVGPCTSSVHVVNVPAREVTNLAPGSNKPVSVAGEGSTLLMQPKWSRDSKTITFLSSSGSIFNGSQLTPAIVNMTLTQR